MNRKIKFRGKRVDNGEWVYGSLLGSCTIRDHSKGFLIRTVDMSTECTYECQGFMVVPETIGQYTGLEDKNGVEIYERDIVNGFEFNGSYGYGFVQFLNGCFIVKPVNNFSDGEAYLHESNMIEIIGNIHEKQETK